MEGIKPFLKKLQPVHAADAPSLHFTATRARRSLRHPCPVRWIPLRTLIRNTPFALKYLCTDKNPYI